VVNGVGLGAFRRGWSDKPLHSQMNISIPQQTLRKVGLFFTLLVGSLLSSPGSDLIPAIEPDPLVAKALQTLSARHPEIPATDLKLALVQCVYDFNNDFDPRKKAAAQSESRAGANAVLTFAVLSTRRDSSNSQTRYAEYEAWKVVVDPNEEATNMPVEKTRVIFSRGK